MKKLVVLILAVAFLFTMAVPSYAASAYAEWFKFGMHYGKPQIAGLRAQIQTPPNSSYLNGGTIKACISTSEFEGTHTLEVGWIWRPGYSSPRLYTIHNIKPFMGRIGYVETLYWYLGWNTRNWFEIRHNPSKESSWYYPTDKNLWFDLIFNYGVLSTKNAMENEFYGSHYTWDQQTYFIGTLGGNPSSKVWSYFTNIYMFNYPKWTYENTAGMMAKRTYIWDTWGGPPTFWVIR